MNEGFVLDSGALIALERRATLLLDLLDEVFRGSAEAVIPRTVIAQVWRGTPRQANIGRLLRAADRGAGPVVIDELTAQRARQIGVAIGRTSHPDIIDAHVALAAAERGHTVLTSDETDIARIDSDLVFVHV